VNHSADKLPARRFALGFALTIAISLLALVPSARAATTDWKTCEIEYFMVDCATYELPLDRTGILPGTTNVRAIKSAATEGPRMGTMFVIAGGPGQASELMLSLAGQLFGGANRYDLVAVDQRGTGRSEALNCPRLESGDFRWDGNDPATDKVITDCSNSLGPARSVYNTAEAVADLEAVRSQLGIPKITLFGVSYGTKVALAYAKAYPQHTQALLLDSVLPTDMPDAFGLDSIAALRGALTTICQGRRCSGFSDVNGNLAKLSARMVRRPIETIVVTPELKIKTVKITASDLYDIVLSADLDPFVYNQLPSALKSALRGNTTQIERLYAISIGAVEAPEDPEDALAAVRRLRKVAPPKTVRKTKKLAPARGIQGRDLNGFYSIFSFTALQATTCAELDSPWARSESTAGRQAAIDSAVASLDAAAIWPVPRSVVSSSSTAAACRGWQQRPELPSIAQGPLPQVPTLALSGSLDVRTPKTWADSSVAGDGKAQSIAIPNVGHSVIGMDISGCAVSLAKRFLIYGGTDGLCRRSAPALPIAPLPVNSVGSVRARSGACHGLRGRRCTSERKQLTAGYLAVRDTLDQILVGMSDYGPGLYGGSWAIVYDITIDELGFGIVPTELRLFDVSNVPGVTVSGSIGLDSMPRISNSLLVNGRRVKISGRTAYDRAKDSLLLSTRSGRRSARIRIRPSGSAGSAAAPTQRHLTLRRTLALASGQTR
jgi:pimeloyl-ACP methyl ester carboxylesterase